METTVRFWQRLDNCEYEVACDYYHNGARYTGGNSGYYYTGKTRSAQRQHNPKIQIRNESEKVNASGGVLNPALLNIG